MKFADGAGTVLQEVRHVPMLNFSWNSCGYEFRRYASKLKVTRGSMIFFREKKGNGIYFSKGVIERPMATIADEETQRVERWHQRLSHISEKGLQ